MSSEDVPMRVRLEIADKADALDEIGCARTAEALLAVVRCCDYFPECAHVFAYVDAIDASWDTTGGTDG